MLRAVAILNGKTFQFVLLNKMQKMAMILDSRNVQVGVLKINRKSIINWLNKGPYMFDSRDLKSRYVHVVIELLKIEYWS